MRACNLFKNGGADGHRTVTYQPLYERISLILTMYYAQIPRIYVVLYKVAPKLATYNLRISGLDIVRLDQELVTERIKRKKPIQIMLTSLFNMGLRDLKKFVI